MRQQTMKRALTFIFFLFTICLNAQVPDYTSAEGLQGYWDFSGNTKDASNYKRDGKPHGVTLVKDRFGNENSAYGFNGTTDYISTDYEGILGSHARAVSFWAIVADSGSYPAVSWGSNELFPNAGGRFDCSFNNTRTGVTMGVSDACITFEGHDLVYDGAWHHYLFQFNKTILKEVEVYQDGVLLTHEPYRFYPHTKINTRRGENVQFGALNAEHLYLFKGQMDDIALYDRMLTRDEIKDLYNAPDPIKKLAYKKWISIFLALIVAVILAAWIIRARVRKIISKEKEKMGIEKKWYEQENRVLKAQMDPHFIFNALNSIQQFIIANDNDKAQLYLSTFSQLIRMQLESNTNENIPLKQEIEILEKYLEIESLRFNNAFDYEIIIAKTIDTNSVYIPYFLIQPFVENAIHHGLLPKKGYKELTITVEMPDSGMLMCTVEDNGIGRKNAMSKTTPFKTKSLGVNFVEQRLLIMSKIEKRKFEVQITDKEDELGNSTGTRAIITLPIVNKS